MSTTGDVAVLGGGSWGTALAINAARGGNTVRLWARDAGVIEEINRDSTNEKYLPGMKVDPGIEAVSGLAKALAGAQLALIVTPAQTIRETADRIAGAGAGPIPLVVCAKGIERETGKLPAAILAELLPEFPVAALSGPSFAADVARGLPTAVTIGANDMALSSAIAERLSTKTLRCYASDDLAGVELGGALKNVIALAVGAAHGMALGASAQAALTARGFAEMSRLASALGAKPQTLAGLSGLGDLVLTCSGPQSRNFAFGMALGQGKSLENLPLAEGAHTAAIAAQLASQHNVQAPVTEALSAILAGRITAREAVGRLMDRPLKSEN